MKQKRKIKIGLIIFIVTFFVFLFWGIPTLIINQKTHKIISNDLESAKQEKFELYHLVDLYQLYSDKAKVKLSIDNPVVYTKECEVELLLTSLVNSKDYHFEYFIDEKQVENGLVDQKENKILIHLDSEGEHIIQVRLLEGNNLISEDSKKVYYIKPYQKQFLDEFSNKGSIVHYLNGSWEKYEKTSDLLINCGIKTIRTTFSWQDIEKDNKKDIFNFDYYDKWIKKLTDNGVNIIACFNRIAKYSGEDGIINTEEEKEEFLKFAKEVIKRYPQIKNYEFINEPNLNDQYITDEDAKWYATVLEELCQIEGINVATGGTNTPDEDTESYTKSSTFFKQIFDQQVYRYCRNYAYHPYDSFNRAKQNERFYMKLDEHSSILTTIGGFTNHYITEYGIHITEADLQAAKIIQQSTILDKYNVRYAMQYNFWNTGNDLNNVQHNYGLITYEGLPKSSYYAVKNYYQKVNGAEYIGTINLMENLEAHVYDKEGKPMLITWSSNANKKMQISYQNFTAKDLYDQEIPNTNGTLTITTSPIYLDNLSTNYFYQAISTTASQKYEEFLTSFEPELTQIPELNQSIITLKTTIESLKDKTDLDENLAKELMAKHYNLGNELISYCRSGKLTVEYVKLSSMLDKLNDIGNSYEDLVTVSAKTRNLSLDQTNQAIQKVEQQIEQNQDLDIIYPTKILEFSQDYYEKANYINNLEEENEIKTGLIVSKNLHAKYLASWAEQFTNLYLDEYIEANPLTLSYSQTNLTNQDVTVTLSAPYDFQVTNNHQAKTYTFTQNGSFTFHYSIRGQAKEMTATVTNIDKTPPTITGVEEGKLYFDEAKPIVQDENLQEVKLIVNDQVFESYETNTTIKVEGIYQLIATDKAGNQTKVSFEIIETPDLNYQIKEDKILNIKNNTTKSIFDQTIRINTSYQIKRQNKVLTNADKIATGDILETSGGQTYALIVAGDIDGDGEVGTIDLVKMRKYLLGAIELNDIEKLAADANVDGKAVGIQDLVRLRILILSKDN